MMRVRRGFEMPVSILALIGLAAAPKPTGLVAAQEPVDAATGCGWTREGSERLPPGMRALQAALASEPSTPNAPSPVPAGALPALREGLVQLEAWLLGCDEVAARKAVLSFRAALATGSSNPVLRAALATGLARGVEVQPAWSEGYLHRPTYQFSNSETQARRLFAQALETWSSPG